jgi:GR25 family glycosyltransferase involved in LPS biosynthesis
MNCIDKIYYINLEHRKDRREHMETWLRETGVPEEKIERIDAVYNKERGIVGCVQSHIKALETFINSDHLVCCLFEDDYIPVNKNSFWESIDSIFANNIEFDIIQLSYNKLESTNSSYTFLVKPTHAQTTSGYLITREFAPKLIENFKEGMEKLIEYYDKYGIKNGYYCLDAYWDKLMPNYKWYVYHPRLGYQLESYSDIENSVVNYMV